MGERMTEVEKKIDMLLRTIDEKYHEIDPLKNHIENQDGVESSQTHAMKTKERVLCRKASCNT